MEKQESVSSVDRQCTLEVLLLLCLCKVCHIDHFPASLRALSQLLAVEAGPLSSLLPRALPPLLACLAQSDTSQPISADAGL